jgi:WD40 repeat protein
VSEVSLTSGEKELGERAFVCVCSSSGRYLLTGSSNGVVRMHCLTGPLSSSSSSSTLGSYWALSVHDNQNGAVTHLSTTCDDRYVISGGADGNIFVFSTHLPTETTPTATPSLEVQQNCDFFKVNEYP